MADLSMKVEPGSSQFFIYQKYILLKVGGCNVDEDHCMSIM